MSYISSINFKKSNAIQTRHNDRDLPPNYLIGGNNEVNRNHKEALALRNEIVAKAMQNYTQHIGQRFKAKSYEWSAVCNIKPDTTMQDLENLAKHFSDKYGFQCYQIAIHRDEGHIDDNGNKVINHHAHLEFITLDKETGKSLFRAELQKPKALRQMQTEVAEILQMERGQDKRISKRERIEPRKYAQMKEQERKALRELKERDKRDKSEIEKKYIVFSNKVHKAISLTFDVLDYELDTNTTKAENYAERLEVISETAKYYREEHKQILALKEQKARLEQELQTSKAVSANTAENTLSVKEIKDYLEKTRKECIGKGYPQQFFKGLSQLKQTTRNVTLIELDELVCGLLQAYEIKQEQCEELAIKNAELESKAEHYELRTKTLEREKKELKEELEKEKLEKEKLEKEKQHSEEIDKLVKKYEEAIETIKSKDYEISVLRNTINDLTNENEKVIPTQHQSQEIDLKADSKPKTKAQILREFGSKCHSSATSYTQETEIETETDLQQRKIRRR